MGDNSVDRFIIFKTENPIKPTYYGLVTGGDTDTYKDRNWKNWKIWAANFNSDEEATKDAEGWVLIDQKENVGTDILKTTNCFESYIYLSEGCAEPYKYFKIEVYHTGGMQMNEFTFYNTGNLFEYRDEFAMEFEDYNPCDSAAYKGLTDEFKAKYQELQTTVNAPDVMKIRNELVDLKKEISASAKLYAEYDSVYAVTENLSKESQNLGAWHEGYCNENIGPNAKFINGPYAYIKENCSLDDDAIKAEITYLERINNAVENGLYILLGGHTVGQWGDGFYGNLIDGIAENTKEKDPETGEEKEVKATKWGGQADPHGDTYIIFRTFDPVNPFFYTLTTGNDTGSDPSRNWGTWYIYGANFEGDAQATKDAEGWVLVDSREDVKQDRLHPVNAQPSYLDIGKEAAAKAINDAKKSVAEQNRFGEIGKAEADRDKDIRIAETSRDTRIKTAAANALAVEGENNSKISIANSDALRREKEAEAARIAVAAEKVQAAKALEEAYKSERDAELARAERENATMQANVVVPAQIEKEKAIIDAEAEAEKIRRMAKGEADAIYAKMDAQARGALEILSKQAQGFNQMVAAAAGDPQKAVLMLIADKLPELVKTQVEAVKGIKIDKVTVWDGNGSKDGKTSTANFISGLMGSVPPLEDLFKMAGMNLPSYLKGENADEQPAAAPKEEE